MPNNSTRCRAPHVLLAEDDYEFRRLLTEALRRVGFRVRSVDTGRALLRALCEAFDAQAPVPAVVISDQCMPGGVRGLDAFRYVRELGWTLPLVLVTAYEDEDVLEEAAHAGVVVVRKPFDVDDVCTMACFLTAGQPGLPH